MIVLTVKLAHFSYLQCLKENGLLPNFCFKIFQAYFDILHDAVDYIVMSQNHYKTQRGNSLCWGIEISSSFSVTTYNPRKRAVRLLRGTIRIQNVCLETAMLIAPQRQHQTCGIPQ